MKIAPFLMLTACIYAPSPVLAADEVDTVIAAQCAWTQVAETSVALLAQAKADKKLDYSDVRSPSVGLLMRIGAACNANIKAIGLNEVYADSQRSNFFKALRKTKSKSPSKDIFSENVYRCEVRFIDDVSSEKPVAVGWGYGSDLNQYQLYYSQSIQGMKVADLGLQSAPKKEGDIAAYLLNQIDKIEPIEVETKAEGERLDKAFVVRRGAGDRRCKIIASDGSLTDA